MYPVALSVDACLRAGTRVDLAWVVETRGIDSDPAIDVVALTPGGGRIGELLGGAVDAQLTDVAQRGLSHGRIVDLQISDVDAIVAGLDSGGDVRCAVVPATEFPEHSWRLLLDRIPVCVVASLSGDEISAIRVHTADDIDGAGEEAAELFRRGQSATATIGDELVTVLHPVPRLVVTGDGPIADALRSAAALLGWQVLIEADPGQASGLMANLSPLDGVVVIGHDVESSSRVLAAALEGDAGYIGAVGSLDMQRQRADWLAYRGITDLGRVHGPAGVDIGAATPPEIAVSILAEAIAAHRRRG